VNKGSLDIMGEKRTAKFHVKDDVSIEQKRSYKKGE